jgi:hypothetical protein
MFANRSSNIAHGSRNVQPTPANPPSNGYPKGNRLLAAVRYAIADGTESARIGTYFMYNSIYNIRDQEYTNLLDMKFRVQLRRHSGFKRSVGEIFYREARRFVFQALPRSG